MYREQLIDGDQYNKYYVVSSNKMELAVSRITYLCHPHRRWRAVACNAR
jgi:hypothetical protein